MENEDLIAKLKSPESCEQFAINVEARKPELALRARRKAVELRAAAHGAKTDAEREALEAVYAYERTQTKSRGRKFKAVRTWQMIDRRGVIPAVEHIVTQGRESMGYAALAKAGMQDKAFEAVVLRHPTVFSKEAVQKSRERLGQAAP